MIRWEYCKILKGAMTVAGGGSSTAVSQVAGVRYLGTDENSTRVEEVEHIDEALARLGLDGWELVSYTMVWAVVEAGITGPAPVMECYVLKRPMIDEQPM